MHFLFMPVTFVFVKHESKILYVYSYMAPNVRVFFIMGYLCYSNSVEYSPLVVCERMLYLVLGKCSLSVSRQESQNQPHPKIAT
jgi:hypothetical protein